MWGSRNVGPWQCRIDEMGEDTSWMLPRLCLPKAGQKLDTGHCQADFLDPHILPGKINEKFDKFGKTTLVRSRLKSHYSRLDWRRNPSRIPRG